VLKILLATCFGRYCCHHQYTFRKFACTRGRPWMAFWNVV